jgi:MFS family permease
VTRHRPHHGAPPLTVSPRVIRSFARIASAFPIPQPNETVPGSAPALLGGPRAAAVGRVRRLTAVRRSLKASLVEGAVAEVFGALATGAVTTAWALYLGAGPAIFGLLGALPLGAQLINLPVTWFTERIGRKRLAVAAVGASRLIYLPLVFLPLLPVATGTKLRIFLAVVAMSTLLGVAGNNAWTAWMGDLVPPRIRGRFFGRRTISVSLAGTLATLSAAIVLDHLVASRDVALTALTGGACVAGLLSITLLQQQTEPRSARAPRASPVGQLVRSCLRDRMVRPYLHYQFAWNAAVALSAGFFSYHMLANLQTGFLIVAMHGILVAAVRIASAPLWGQAVDRLGARPVIVLCSFGISVVPLIWFLTTPDRLWPIALEALIAGLLWAGHGIAGVDLSINLAPRVSRSVYLAAIATAGGIGFTISSIGAGRIAAALPDRLDVDGYWLTNIHVLFLLSAIGRFSAAVLARRIYDPDARGGVRDVVRVVGRELARVGVWKRLAELVLAPVGAPGRRRA